jgi:hypothetical protein
MQSLSIISDGTAFKTLYKSRCVLGLLVQIREAVETRVLSSESFVINLTDRI